MADNDIDINISRSPMATVIGGLFSAIGGIGNAVGSSVKLVTKTVETVSDAVKAASAGGKSPAETVNQSNLGLIAAAAQENVKTTSGGGTLPPRKAVAKSNPDPKLSTEKLLSIVVSHLSSIDSTLKAQMDHEVDASREQASQQKENEIENQSKNSVFTRMADRMKMRATRVGQAAKEKGGDLLQTAAMVAAAALALKLSTLKTDEIEKLKDTITKFQEKYSWFFEDLLPAIGGAMIGFRWAGPWGAFIGAISAALITWNNRDNERIRREQKKEQDAARSVGENSGSKAVKDAINSYVDAVAKYQETLKLPGGSSDPANKAYQARAQKEVSATRDKVVKAMKDAGYSEKQIDTLTSVEFQDKFKNVDEAINKIGAPENAPKPDAQKANGAGNIPDAAYNIVWNNGKDLAPPKPLSQMTVAEVLEYQSRLGEVTAAKGKRHTVVGAFQINRQNVKNAMESGLIKPTDLFNRTTQEKISTRLFEENKSGNMATQWPSLSSKKGAYRDKSFDDVKYNIALNEVGPYAGMTGDSSVSQAQGEQSNDATAVAKGVGATAEALGTVRAALLDTVSQKSTFDPNMTPAAVAKNNIVQTATKIQEQAIAVENEMRGSAKKEADRVAAINRMTPGEKLRAANNGKLEAIDPNYKVDPNNIISKYFVHFGLVA